MLFITIALHAQRFVNTTLDGAQAVYAITQDTSGVVWVPTMVSTVMMATTTIVILLPIPLVISASMRSASRVACSIWLRAMEC